MADHLVRTFKQRIGELALLPSDGGRFEIKVDDELIYSKLASGQFPANADIESSIREKL